MNTRLPCVQTHTCGHISRWTGCSNPNNCSGSCDDSCEHQNDGLDREMASFTNTCLEHGMRVYVYVCHSDLHEEAVYINRHWVILEMGMFVYPEFYQTEVGIRDKYVLREEISRVLNVAGLCDPSFVLMQTPLLFLPGHSIYDIRTMTCTMLNADGIKKNKKKHVVITGNNT